jgi:hypothetical protein
MVTYVPVRKGFHRPLHLGTATGRGYRTACGKTLEGADVDVPRPRVPRLTRRGLEDFYLLELYGGDLDAPTRRRAEMRRTVTDADPMAFALTYLWHHLASEQTGNEVTLSPSTSTGRTRAAPRRPGTRSGARSSPLARWGSRRGGSSSSRSGRQRTGTPEFIAAFADASKLAETHLATFLTELRTNERLREDFPDLCTATVTRRGITDADRADLYRAKSGFVFAARGMESQALGLKIGHLRPDLIILDDIEPAEENYSAALTAKRLATLQDTILPLNDKARVVFVGTVTRATRSCTSSSRSLEVRCPDDERSRWIARTGGSRSTTRRSSPSTTGPGVDLAGTLGAGGAGADRAHPVVREELR